MAARSFDPPAAVADPADLSREERRRRTGRRMVLGLVALKAALLVLAAIAIPAADPYPTRAASQAAAAELYLFVVGYGALVLLPSFLLARKGRLIGLCLALLILPDLFAILFLASKS